MGQSIQDLDLNRDQRIRDPIHNLVSFSHQRDEDRMLWLLLSTFPVQRLRRIKQLGFSEFVYPGATHSRFSHVIGAMQMARRMLGVFEKNDQFSDSKNHSLMRMATIAAAMLHDVGHGPYSHVFEEISSALGIEEEHENLTKKIIEQTEIRGILEKFGILEQTIKFFTKEPGYSPYTTIISSQMDCDRLDFLARDRYHTGIQSSSIDFEWLFDSLRIEEVHPDPIAGQKEFSFVVQEKGLSSIEEYVISYMKMYKEVYFHKTTRSVQHLVRDAMKGLVNLDQSKTKAIRQQRLFSYLLNKKKRGIENFLLLDDSCFIHALHSIAEANLGDPSKLAERFFKRDTYKCLELPTSNSGKIKANLAGKFIDALKTDGIFYIDDILPAKTIKQYDVMEKHFLQNILVKKDGEAEPLGEVSNVVGSLGEKRVRLYFKTEQDREKAKVILRKCQSAQ